MKHSKRIVSFLTALAVSSSFVSCQKDEEADKTIEEEPEVTTEATEAPAPVEEKGQEYKLTTLYEETPLADLSLLTGEATDILYGGSHLYVLTDDVTYTSGSGMVMCNIDLASMKRSDIYNAPEGYFYQNDDKIRLPEGFELGEGDTLYTVFSDRVLYGNEKGVCVRDIKTGAEKVIEKAGTTDMPVIGAFYDGKKYIIVYQEKAQTLKHFYVTDAEGVVSEETKMTLGYTGKIENTFVNGAGDLFFTKVDRTSQTIPLSATETKTNETTKIEIYRMRPDGSLTRMVGGEDMPFNITVDALSVSAEGDILIQETDPVRGRTIQQYDSYGIRSATYTYAEEDIVESAEYFCKGSDIWAVYTEDDGAVSLAPLDENGAIVSDMKIITEIGSVKNVLAGDSVYDLYITDDASVYGVKLYDRTYEEIMQWTDADTSINAANLIGVRDGADLYCLKEEEVEKQIQNAVTAETPAAENISTEDEEEEDMYSDSEEDEEETDEDSEAEDSDEEDSEEDDEDSDSDDEDEDEEDDEEDYDEEDSGSDEDETEETDASADISAPVELTTETIKETVVKPVRLTKASQQRLNELNSRRIITVAGDISTTFEVNGVQYSITEQIKEFNKSNDQYYIHPVSYVKSQSAEAASAGLIKLEEEIEGGYTPDFIIYDSADYDFESLAEANKFADMRDLMADDPQVKADDILGNITELCTVNDTMYRLFPYFTGRTFMAGESAVENGKQWKMKDYLESATVGNTVYSNEEDALRDILAVYALDHTDFENSKCDFDNDEFREMLQWADAFLPVEDAIEEYGASYNDYSNAKTYDVRCETLKTPAKFNYEECETGETQYLKGLPADSGKMLLVEPGTSFSVLKTSDAKVAVWAFIRQFFTEDFYGWGQNRSYTESEISAHINSTQLPVRESVLDSLIEDTVSMKFERMLYGEDYAPVYYAWGEEYDLPEISAETSKMFKDAVTGSAWTDIRETEYFSVIFDEAVLYFTDPDLTVEDASAGVQREATAYLLRNN